MNSKYQQLNAAIWNGEVYKQEFVFNKLKDLYRYSDAKIDIENPYSFLLFNYAYHNVKIGHHNLGDYIQTIATQDALSSIFDIKSFEFWDRDSLSFYGLLKSSPAMCCIMQGWFSHNEHFLPSKNILPVYVGTHLSVRAQVLLQRILCIEPQFFQGIEFGCRDQFTLEFCRQFELDSYFSRCLTLTLQRGFFKQSQNRRVLLVDIPLEWESYLPLSMQRTSMRVSQKVVEGKEHWKTLYKKAESLLDFYAHSAGLVITTALHCAAPCLAMGIPVVLIAVDKKENMNRFSALKGLLPVYTFDELKSKKIPFYEARSLALSNLRSLLLENLELSIKKAFGCDYDRTRLELVRDGIDNYKVSSRAYGIEISQVS